MPDRFHIYPVRANGAGMFSSHCTDKTEMCWCKPEIKQVCSESNRLGQCETSCWRCGGSGYVDPYDQELNYLIIHKPGQMQDALENLRGQNVCEN